MPERSVSPDALTALAVVVGAVSFSPTRSFRASYRPLMAGEIASLLISRMAVPVLYFMAKADRRERIPEASSTQRINRRTSQLNPHSQ